MEEATAVWDVVRRALSCVNTTCHLHNRCYSVLYRLLQHHYRNMTLQMQGALGALLLLSAWTAAFAPLAAATTPTNSAEMHEIRQRKHWTHGRRMLDVEVNQAFYWGLLYPNSVSTKQEYTKPGALLNTDRKWFYPL